MNYNISLQYFFFSKSIGENREELSKYAKNYLPILFNLFSTETKDKNEERIRLAVYETCKAFLQITDKEVFCNKFPFFFFYSLIFLVICMKNA